MTLKQQIQEFEASGANREELSAAVRELVAREGVERVAAMRFAAPGARRPTDDEQIARMGSEERFKALLKDANPATSGGIYKADQLDKKTLAAVLRTILFPFIWLWKLPALSEAKIKNFSEHAALWVERYLPNGLAIFDHIALVGVIMDCLWDCFRRKANGEPPEWETDEQKEIRIAAAEEKANVAA